MQVYWLQFGRYFARGPIVSSDSNKILKYRMLLLQNNGRKKNASNFRIYSLWQERDDYALELAMGDE